MYIVISMYKVPVTKADLFSYQNFMTPEECETVIEYIKDNNQRSTTSSGNAAYSVSDYRTSRTCMLHKTTNDIVRKIDARICKTLGLDASFGEQIQGQMYNPGEYFKRHTDYFEPDSQEYQNHCKVRGNRTWTFMVYLNEPELGG